MSESVANVIQTHQREIDELKKQIESIETRVNTCDHQLNRLYSYYFPNETEVVEQNKTQITEE